LNLILICATDTSLIDIKIFFLENVTFSTVKLFYKRFMNCFQMVRNIQESYNQPTTNQTRTFLRDFLRVCPKKVSETDPSSGAANKWLVEYAEESPNIHGHAAQEVD